MKASPSSRDLRSFRRQVAGEATGEIACVSHARLCQCPATCLSARVVPTAGEAILAAYLTALPRQNPLTARLSSNWIYLGQPRDHAADARQLPAHLKMDCSACTRSFRSLFGGIFAFSFMRSRAGAPKGVSPASKRARSPAARSLPRRSSAAAARLAAVERPLRLPWSLLPPLPCAGRQDYESSSYFAGQQLPCASQSARSAARAHALV